MSYTYTLHFLHRAVHMVLYFMLVVFSHFYTTLSLRSSRRLVYIVPSLLLKQARAPTTRGAGSCGPADFARAMAACAGAPGQLEPHTDFSAFPPRKEERCSTPAGTSKAILPRVVAAGIPLGDALPSQLKITQAKSHALCHDVGNHDVTAWGAQCMPCP